MSNGKDDGIRCRSFLCVYFIANSLYWQRTLRRRRRRAKKRFAGRLAIFLVEIVEHRIYVRYRFILC